MITEIQKQLNRIEGALAYQKSVLTLNELCQYTGLSKSCIYKLTSSRKIPFSCPNGKTLFFNRLSIDEWLLSNPAMTQSQINSAVVNHVLLNPKFGGDRS